jgi:DeoR family transcriptional regulator, glycerol-3-phosphate regulon repressor
MLETMTLRSDNRGHCHSAAEGALGKRLTKLDRHSRIVSELRVQPSIRVHELADLLAVSTETIRRDLSELDDRGLINRTYGGAMRPMTYEPALAERQALMVAERERIAAAAVDLIERDDILMIGGGATTLHFARRLAAEVEHLTVITHAFSIAQALAAQPPIKVLMLPGQYDGREGIIVGADTIDALQRFHANKAILGASGLTQEGPNDAAMTAGQIYGAMMRRASETLVLADHSKFDRPSLTVFGPWNENTTLVCDRRPEGELKSALDMAGVTIVEAALSS